MHALYCIAMSSDKVEENNEKEVKNDKGDSLHNWIILLLYRYMIMLHVICSYMPAYIIRYIGT